MPKNSSGLSPSGVQRKQNLLFLLFNYPVIVTKRFVRVKKYSDTPWNYFGWRRKCSIRFVHFSRVWPRSKIPSEYTSLNGRKLFWIMHAINGLLKRWPTFHVTIGLKQNTRNSVIGLKRLKKELDLSGRKSLKTAFDQI